MHHATLKNISGVMVLVLLFTWSSIPPDLVFAAKANMPAKENLEQAAQKLERLFDALEDAVKAIPRDTFDPKAIVEKLGTDPEKLFEWVRDNTYLVPYRGTLRGPIGVLMDRLGNSLDRALLLYDLLTIAGHKAQLARGTLSKEQAEMVLSEARPVPPGGALPAEQESRENIDELISKYAEKYGLNLVELHRVTQKMTLQQQHMAEEVAQRVEEQTKAILELVGEPEIDIRAAERAKAIEALQDYWWVQWKGASGWIELDSTLPDAKAGETLVKAEKTHQADEIDEELQHRVTIRVVIERWEDGKLEEKPVLEYTLRPSKLFGKRIVLRHVPLNWPEDLDLFAEEKPLERLKTAVLKEKEWLPVLSVGSEQIVQSSFTDQGEVKDEPGKKPVSPAEDLGRGVRGPFGGMLGALSGGEPELDVRKESHLAAERIDYFITIPGEPSRAITRHIFDFIDPKYRSKSKAIPISITKSTRLSRALFLLGETEVAIQVCGLSPEFLTDRLLENILSNLKILKELFEYRPHRGTRSLIPTLSELTPSLGPGYSFILARARWSPLPVEAYLASVNIVNFERKIRTLSDKEKVLYEVFDILENTLAVHLSSDIDPFKARIKQGIMDTNLEALLISEKGHPRGNVAELMLRSAQQGISWLALGKEKDLSIHREDLAERTYVSELAYAPMDVRAYIEEDLKNGYLVITPSEGNLTDTGWWRVDPLTGTTLGKGEGGRGITMTERTILQKWGAYFVGGIRYLVCVQRECRKAFTSREFDICVLKCMVKGALFGFAAYGLKIKTLGSIAAAYLGFDIVDDFIEELYDFIDAL